jgi:solute carrier family 27 (fatty acid transporter), member 1/4
MAAVVDPDNKIDIDILAAGIRNNLPVYARPIFIRILPQLPMTGTFKLKKRDLQLEGYDITKIKDKIYILQSDGSYKVMTDEQNTQIKEGLAKL